MLKTAICNLFGIEYPIIQGGMAYLATAELGSAVSNAGGLGVIAAGQANSSWLAQQIRLIRQLTAKPFGVNIYLHSPLLNEQIDVILQSKVPVVITGSGNPSSLIPRFKASGAKVLSVIANVEQAKKMEACGVDAVIAEGMEAGGHVSETATLPLVPQIVDAVKIPVIAAGGIADGRGLVAALVLGAQGVQMGTRFICSEECLANWKFKKRLINSSDLDTQVIGGTIHNSVRCLKNKFSAMYAELEKAGATPEELEIISRGCYYAGVINGDVDEGFLMAGQICGLIRDIKPVNSIIKEIITASEKIICSLPHKFQVEGCSA
jgi:enoyl-[acyl-carrier protein] reductase II